MSEHMCTRHEPKALGEPFTNPSAAALSVCAFPACGRPRFRRDLCQSHYRKSLTGAPLKPIRNPDHQPCSVDGCDSDARAGGMCNLHYQRKRNGIPVDGPIQRRAAKRAAIKPSPGDMDRLRALSPAAKIRLHRELSGLRRLSGMVLAATFTDVGRQIDRTIDELAQLIRDDLNQERRKAA